MNWSFIASSAVVATIAAFVLTQAARWLQNSKESRAILRGMQLEIDHAEKCAAEYLKESAGGQPWAPAYRLETEFLRPGIQKLAANAHLSEDEVKRLYALYIAAGEANRSLNLLEDLNNRTAKPPAVPLGEREEHQIFLWLQLETSRARIKFANIQAAIPAARSAAAAALARLAWYESSN